MCRSCPRFPVACARRLSLYPSRHALYRKSQVDFDTSVNATLFPDFPPLHTNVGVSTDVVDECTPIHVDLEPGDMLYLPPMVVHHVEALSDVTMGYNVFSGSTVSEGVGELSELAKIPLVHELAAPVETAGAAAGENPPNDDMVASTWLTQRCLLRLVAAVMTRYAWDDSQPDRESCSASMLTSTLFVSNKSASECKAKQFVRDFLTRRYAPLQREGVEIWRSADAVTLFRGFCAVDGQNLSEGSWWESRAAKRTISELLHTSLDTASPNALRNSWDATCDSRTEGVFVLLDGLSQSPAGLHGVEVALQGYLEEQAWHLVGLEKIQPFLLACLAT